MNDTERQLLAALQELDVAVKSMPTATTKPNLLPIFTRIAGLRDALPRGSSPDLLHYLHKHSYEKARLYLEGRDAENARGTCLH